jgi:catechol-2,3-dioxygenase
MARPGLSFTHIGLYAHDMEAMERFYTGVLEFFITDRGRLQGPDGPLDLVFMSRDPDEHHQIVLVSGRPAELSFNVVNQLSFKADSLATLREMHRRVRAHGLRNINAVTHGNALSIYALDPEGTRLEIYWDLPWYVTQPTRVPVDVEQDDAKLMADALAHARQLPGFKPRSEWRAEMARIMGLE